jgi:sporulation protein YlmC with PRC-barrel domain
MRADIFEVGLALVAVASFSSAVVIFVGSLATAQGTQKPGKPSNAATQPSGLQDLDRLTGIGLVSSAGKDLGRLDDVIVGADEGRLTYAIVSTGGLFGIGARQRVIPWPRVKIVRKIGGESGELLASTHLSAAQLESAPAFDPSRPFDADLARRAREATGNQEPDADELYVEASKLRGARTLGPEGEPIGEVERLIVDPPNGFVAYLVTPADESLGLGERSFALPWAALRVGVDGSKPEVRALLLNKELYASAPLFAGVGSERMYTDAWIQEISSYYHVEAYGSKSVQASAPAKGR